nr:retropepsin-like aspartic protease [Spartinivicinus marinus]
MQSFKEQLADWNTTKIVDHYRKLTQLDDEHKNFARAAFIEKLQQGFEQGQYQQLIKLINSYLQFNAGDYQVVYILAESYRALGNLPAAIKAYYQLEQYVYDFDQIENIKAKIHTLVQAYHKKVVSESSEGEHWPLLLKFYEELALLDSNNYGYLFKQAEIHYQLNDFPRSLALLDYLLADVKWGNVARQLKHKIATKIRAKEGIALRQNNGHYIVSGVIDNSHQVELLIDTGATLSVVSTRFFKQLGNNSEAEFLHNTMMSTANGQLVVPVYRFKRFEIAGRAVNDIEFAVMDLPSMEVSQGLLGMNFLRNFRFNMDQENSLLFLDLK